MEQHGQSQQQQQRQRQRARQMYGEQQQEANGSEQVQHPAPGSAENLRQSSYIQQSPVPTGSGRPVVDPQQVYGLTPGGQYGAGSAMQPGAMQYGQDMPTSAAARQQSQQYSQYAPNPMYGMGQPQGAQTAQPSYEQVPPYRQRPGGGSEPLATQFGVPQYYLAGQPGPGGGSVPELPTQTLPSQYHQPDPYADASSSAVPAYPASEMDPSQSATYAPYAQQAQYTTQVQIPSDDQPFENYQAQIRNIFTLAREGSLRDIGTRLLEISQYLLGNVEGLGLTRDDETLHDGRIRLWDEFNRAWLVPLQRQFDLTQQVMQHSQPLTENQSLMDAQSLDRLSSELVRLCDNIEKHGLVDYQMGVAEEEIMELLLRCLSLLNGRTQEGVGSSAASTAGSSRRR